VQLKAYVLGTILYWYYRLLQLTWRLEVRESESLKKVLAEGGNFVVAHWHGEELGLLHLLARYKVACMVSTSFDGELVTRIIHLSGSKTVRGSSTRGAVTALKGILRLAKEGWRPSVAVDGPRGPRHQVKLGVIEIAKVMKAPIFTINMACSRSHIFEKSWNKQEMPKTFTKMVVTWGEPIYVDPTRDLNDYTGAVAEALHEGRRKSRAAVGLA
jgi:lysophospholipid acyltransferase (LPLAT)-like uncharacterized protein